MRYPTTSVIVLAAVLTAGCSTTPRAYAPQLAAAPADELAFQETLARCQGSAGAAGGASTGTKVVSGAGAAAVGGTAASGASWGGAVALGAASIVALPVVGLVWGLSRSDRAKKERRIQETTGQCLQEDGYAVAGWTRIKKGDAVQATLAEAAPGPDAEAVDPQAEAAVLASSD